MRSVSAHADSRRAVPMTGSTAAVLALLALAMTVSAQGASVAALGDALSGARPMLRDASAARELAAAVTAAVRDLVGHDMIDTGATMDGWRPAMSAPTAVKLECEDQSGWRCSAPPILVQLLNIPPPTN